MKKYIINISAIAAILIAASACDSRFDDYNTNPNESTFANSSMLATNCIRNLFYHSSEPKGYMRDEMLAKYIVWTEANDIDIAFNKLGRASFSDMTNVYNVQKMIDNAGSDDLKVSYEGVGHIIRAFRFFDLTMQVGDIPYSEAMKGEDGIEYPKYDSQRDVMLGLLNELDQANELLADAVDIDGDIVYGGDVSQWRKAGNVLALKILINLYDKTSDSELNVQGRFQDIVSNRPLFTSNDDNFQLVHSDKSGQKADFYKEGNNYLTNPYLSSELVDSLKALGDYRLFYYGNPTQNAINEGLDASDWDAYTGVEATLTEEEIQSAVLTGGISHLNDRYSEDPVGEPTTLLSYYGMNFILAEACVRGLISGDAQSYYEEGISAAMKFTADNTQDNESFHHGRVITEDYINEYLTYPGVAFASTQDRQIEQIIEQKYLSSFMQERFNAYYEYRRTGYPVLPVNPLSNRNDPTSKMPVRWMYPQDEYSYNTENVNDAVSSQFGGVDDNNQLMWLIK